MELGIKGLTKQFKDKTAVDHVDLTITPGVWGLLGANGAGKTTLMRMIAGLSRPTEGTVTYDGIEIGALGEKYRDLFGYLPQEFGFYPEFTVWDYLDYIAALKGMTRKEAEEKIEKILPVFGLSDVRRKKITKLSGGTKRRVGIAQALLNDPEILILDEPTSGLDPGERVRFRNLLSEFASDRIVLISTHIVSDVEYIAGEILIMKEGRLIHRGAPDAITHEIDGKVWECRVDPARAEELCSRYNVGNLKNVGNKTTLRIIGDEKPMEEAVPAEASLEDLYLYYFQEEGR